MNWTSIKIEPPPLNKRVCIYAKSDSYEDIAIANWNGVHWAIEGVVIDSKINITHWMPLPDPPNKPSAR